MFCIVSRDFYFISARGFISGENLLDPVWWNLDYFCFIFWVICRGRPLTWSVMGGLCFWVRCDYGFNKMRLFHGDMMTPEGLSVWNLIDGPLSSRLQGHWQWWIRWCWLPVLNSIGASLKGDDSGAIQRNAFDETYQTHERQCIGISKHQKRVENMTCHREFWTKFQVFLKGLIYLLNQNKSEEVSREVKPSSRLCWRIINEFEKSSVIYINSILAQVGDSCTLRYCIALLRNKVVIGRMQLFLSEALQMLK